MPKYLSLMLVLVLLTSCAQARISAGRWLTQQTLDQPEEYFVYATLLKERFLTPEIKRLVIEAYTSIDDQSFSDLDETIKRAAPLSAETAANFRSKRARLKLHDDFGLAVEVDFLSQKERATIFKRSSKNYDGWRAFYGKYPASPGILKLSRVGFNADKSQALIFVAHSCGWLCGEGNYFVLVKKDGEWKIMKELVTWMS